MARYDLPIPYGWFYVCAENDLEPGEVRALRRFARNLVLWRDEDGEYHLQDAYCPHLGANIAIGGKVHGRTIACPFHGWRFDGTGSVAAIPYARTRNENARLTTYPIQMHYHWIMAWYHPEGLQPSFALPRVPQIESTDYIGPFSRSHEISTHIQEMAENTVDAPHFQTIHKHPGAATYTRMEFDGSRMIMESKQTFPGSRGPVAGTLSAYTSGMGFAVVEYRTLVDVCMVTTQAPVEADRCLQLFHVFYRNPDRDEKTDRIGQAFVNEVNRQIQEDIPIWENKIYQPEPQLCDGDGPIHRFRKWARQFYHDDRGQ
jgi:phenylpropionate dioxygenase-like ring-hydroxylating dioxygenase large terminal subunit